MNLDRMMIRNIFCFLPFIQSICSEPRVAKREVKKTFKLPFSRFVDHYIFSTFFKLTFFDFRIIYLFVFSDSIIVMSFIFFNFIIAAISAVSLSDDNSFSPSGPLFQDFSSSLGDVSSDTNHLFSDIDDDDNLFTDSTTDPPTTNFISALNDLQDPFF